MLISPRTLKILVEILFHSTNRFATWKRFCPPKSLTMLNGNAANNSLMNKGTLQLLNRDRKNSRISTNPFAHPSVFSVSRTCRDFSSPLPTTRNDSSSRISRLLLFLLLLLLPLRIYSFVCELFINVGESMPSGVGPPRPSPFNSSRKLTGLRAERKGGRVSVDLDVIPLLFIVLTFMSFF